MNLQEETLTPGQCFLEWREAIFRLRKVGGELAQEMASCIELREEKLLENEIYQAAVWIDPRSRILLSSDEKIKAKIALQSFHLRSENTQPPQEYQRSATASAAAVEPVSDFQAFLNSVANDEASATTSSASQFQSGLSDVEKLG